MGTHVSYKEKLSDKSSLVAHIWIPIRTRLRQEHYKFGASLGYTVRSFFFKWHLWEGKLRTILSMLLTWDFHPSLNDPVFHFLETDKLAKLFWSVQIPVKNEYALVIAGVSLGVFRTKWLNDFRFIFILVNGINFNIVSKLCHKHKHVCIFPQF